MTGDQESKDCNTMHEYMRHFQTSGVIDFATLIFFTCSGLLKEISYIS